MKINNHLYLNCLAFLAIITSNNNGYDKKTGHSFYTTLNANTILSSCNGKDKEQTDSLIARGATLQLVSNQFSFTEGPAVDKHGNIFFTDQPNDKIWKYDTDDKLSLFMDKAGRSNGLYVDHNGNLLACADEKDELWLITPAKKITVLVKDIQGHRLNGPNDLWVDSKGGIYFTDPYYQRPYWDRKTPDITGQKYIISRKEKKNLYLLQKTCCNPMALLAHPMENTCTWQISKTTKHGSM